VIGATEAAACCGLSEISYCLSALPYVQGMGVQGKQGYTLFKVNIIFRKYLLAQIYLNNRPL